jgi:hypothetical protein
MQTHGLSDCMVGLGHQTVYPPMCRSGRSNRSKHGGRLPRLQSIEPLSAAGAVGAADRTRSGAERRERTTAVTSNGPANIGTSGARRARYVLRPCHPRCGHFLTGVVS